MLSPTVEGGPTKEHLETDPGAQARNLNLIRLPPLLSPTQAKVCLFYFLTATDILLMASLIQGSPTSQLGATSSLASLPLFPRSHPFSNTAARALFLVCRSGHTCVLGPSCGFWCPWGQVQHLNQASETSTFSPF